MEKRGEVFFILFLIFLVSNINFLTPASITGEVITGKAIQGVEMNITITAPPVITIINPKNNTYIINNSILLNYTVDPSVMTTWYKIDASTNTTITGPIYFDASQGSHILYLFSNNTNGEAIKNVSFFINSFRLTILYREYNGSLRGSSTEFINYSYEDLQDLSDIILQNTEEGKIKFNSNINITNDEDFSDNLVDLDSHTNISNNRIDINITALPNFNTSATLWLYNLTFTNPRVLRNGAVCPVSICVEKSYVSATGIFVFNVTGFATYTTEETPSDVGESPGASQGGGTRTTPSIPEPINFEVNKELIKIQLKTLERLTIPLKINNKYSTILNFTLKSNLGGLLSLSETEFSISPNQSKEISLNFYAKEEFLPGIYSGKITISTGDETKEIPVVVEIKTQRIIFDVSLNIPTKYKEIYAGEKIVFDLTLFNLGEVAEADVIITYYIKDFEGRIVSQQEETITVGNQVSFSRTITLPEDISAGEYVAAVTVRFDGTVGTSSDLFRVKLEEGFFAQFSPYTLPSLLALIILIIIAIFFILKHQRKSMAKTIISHDRTFKKREKEEKRIDSSYKRRIMKKTKEIKQAQKIKDKMDALEGAYLGGLIKKSSYSKAKKRIKKALK